MKVKGTFQLRQHLDQTRINPYSRGGCEVPSITDVNIIHLVSEEVEFTDPNDLSAAKDTIIDHFLRHPLFDIPRDSIVFEVTE